MTNSPDPGPRYYYRDGTPILPGGEETTTLTWAKLFEDHDYKIVKQTQLDDDNGFLVSTVWLGLDHGLPDLFPDPATYQPLIFETMIFGLPDEYQVRYSTEAEALEGHERAVALVEALIAGAEA